MKKSAFEPDALDYRLLELLQKDARARTALLAQEVGLSEPAVYRRIQRLRDSGTILRDVALVAPRTMGWPLTMLVLVTLERERSEIIDRFIQQLARVPEVVEAWYVTGDHDFVLRVVAQTMESYEAMTRRVLYANEHVKSFKTLVTMRQAKAPSPVPPAPDRRPQQASVAAPTSRRGPRRR